MSKPSSSISTAISIRIPNDLLESVISHALNNGFINESGRTDKRGQPNLSAAIADLLKKALVSNELSDSVTVPDGIPTNSIEEIADRITAKLSTAISQQLNTLLVQKDVSELAESGINYGSLESPPNEQEDTRQRILNAASRGFRMRGYLGIGIDALAKGAGVTSGAFYGYFRSKEDAFLAAVVSGLDEYRSGVESFKSKHNEKWIMALADYYVGRKHRQDLACGCALPTLSPEVIRSSSRVRSAYQTELLKLNSAIANGLTNGTETEKQDLAWVLLALLAGGITLARAVWDENLSDQISKAVHDATVAFSP